ncbi:MAG: GGDEF domain-containing protein, partial [Alkalibacterium sp.]|uniref:GGDEF domain-containing protein n=1 Tax=Alkalibacterium sp. TaxID=1872447 RepID=UPI0039709859
NFRRFEDYWDKVAAEARAHQESCAILMLDIDYFKLTNDTYGHAAGDYILVELGRVMQETIRKKGSVFRKGGEEFVIVLPKSDKAEALEIAENLRSKVEEHDFLTNNKLRIPITVSIGATVYPETINQLSDMIETADAMLYKSKNDGRNRVSV